MTLEARMRSDRLKPASAQTASGDVGDTQRSRLRRVARLVRAGVLTASVGALGIFGGLAMRHSQDTFAAGDDTVTVTDEQQPQQASADLPSQSLFDEQVSSFSIAPADNNTGQSSQSSASNQTTTTVKRRHRTRSSSS